MNLGDVEFQLFEGASSIATYVGYAASVAAMESSSRAIEKIAGQISVFVAQKPEIRNVTIPLLGSGAGGLSAEESLAALMKGLESGPAEDKVFNIFVYDAGIYKKLTRNGHGHQVERKIIQAESERPKTREAVRVFISYTRTSIEHQDWVRDLAKSLRKNGIDARLDIWHVRPGMDLPQWMSNELELADRILIICNEEYAMRADGRLGGVGWEMRLVQGDLLQSQSNNPKKYIPILYGKFESEAVPRFLRGTYCITWVDEDEEKCKESLLRELYEAYEEAPPLGSPPRYVLR